MQANKNEYTQQQKLWSMPPIPIVQVDNKKSAYSNLLLCFKIFFVNIWHYLKFRYSQKILVAQINAFILLLVHLSCGLVFTCLHNYTNTKKVMVLRVTWLNTSCMEQSREFCQHNTTTILPGNLDGYSYIKFI